MQIKDLVGGEVRLVAGDPSLAVTGLSSDSRQARPGRLFAALAGSNADGAKFIGDAIARGASAILTQTGTSVDAPPGVAILTAPEPRRALAHLAARFYPRQPAHIVAVTGTNGKTSVADFTRQLLTALGREAASLGTIGLVKPGGAVYGSLTTPDPVTLHQTLDELAGEAITHLALEASSHGLDQYRLDGVKLAAGAFLNLGRDHLDYHPGIAHYLAAKLGLFTRLLAPGQPAIVNVDAPFADEAVAAARTRGLQVMSVGAAGNTLRLVDVQRDGFKQRLEIEHAGHRYKVPLGLIGTYQAGNALVAAAFAIALGEDPSLAIRALETLEGVSGRLEVVGEKRGGLVVVDYAHKPEALSAALGALRPFATGRLIAVIGCGGNRDAGKRPIMGKIAAEASDIVIVTDDNPRNETPAAIRAAILAGIPPGIAEVLEIGDRASAISVAINRMRSGDVVLIAGKGHETGQIVGSETLPFSDQAAARSALANA